MIFVFLSCQEATVHVLNVVGIESASDCFAEGMSDVAILQTLIGFFFSVFNRSKFV